MLSSMFCRMKRFGVEAVYENEDCLAFVFPGNNVKFYELDKSESKLTVKLDSDLKI